MKINHRVAKEHREEPAFNHGWSRVNTDDCQIRNSKSEIRNNSENMQSGKGAILAWLSRRQRGRWGQEDGAGLGPGAGFLSRPGLVQNNRLREPPDQHDGHKVLVIRRILSVLAAAGGFLRPARRSCDRVIVRIYGANFSYFYGLNGGIRKRLPSHIIFDSDHNVGVILIDGHCHKPERHVRLTQSAK